MPVLSNDEFESFGAPAGAPKAMSNAEFESFGAPAEKPAEPGPSLSQRMEPAQRMLGRASGLPIVGPMAAGLSQINPDLVAEAARNVPHSAVEFAKNTAEPFLHPIETIKNIGDVGHGLAQKLGVAYGGGDDQIAKADAVGKFFADRYGGMENLKKTFATDPVGFLGDMSLVLTGGGGAAARLPGAAGEVGRAAGAVGRAVDPLNAVTAAGRGAGNVASHVAGTTSGAGSDALQIAARTGYEGGEGARVFREDMRGAVPVGDVIDTARPGMDRLRQDRGAEYRQGMARIGNDKTILSWNDVDTALNDMNQVATYKGRSLSPSTEAIRSRIGNTIDEWKNLRASEHWTPEGFDAMKREIGDIRDATQYGTPERRVADQAYNAIKKTIVDQAPEYARVMKGYEEASTLIKEIETTLSMKPGANVDTTVRKLQSIMRNNVNTNYGRRMELGQLLEQNGATHLMAKLAGQSLNTWTPRGLARVVGPVLSGGIGAGASMSLPGAIPALALASPRLMGEAAHLAGRSARALKPLRMVPRVARQAGQLNNSFRNPYGGQ